MSGSTTNLDLISASQAGKEVTANAMFDAASPAMIFGRRSSTTVGLTWGYYGGAFISAGVISQLGNGTKLLTASTTNYLEADSTGNVTVNTVGFTGGRLPLYSIITGATTVTSYVDMRIPGSIGGAINPVPLAYIQSTVVYAASLTLNCSSASIFDITLTGNLTLNLGSPAYDGQRIIVRLKQDATGSRIVTLGTTIRLGTDIPSFVATTTATKTDILGFIYNSAAVIFDTVASAKGY